jgi:hypothetical protein
MDLMDTDDDEDRIRVKLISYGVESLFGITSPDQTSVGEMQVQVSNILAQIENTYGTGLTINTNRPAVAEGLRILPVTSLVGPHWGGVTEALQDLYAGIGDSGIPAENTETDARPSQRSLVADIPKSVKIDSKFSIEVAIVEIIEGSLPVGSLLDVKGGMKVTIHATIPTSFDVDSDYTQEIVVPIAGDSQPRIFTVIPREVGTFRIRFTAYCGGTYLGKLEVETSVAQQISGTSRYALSPVPLDGPRAGEVSLQITYEETSNTFRFLFIADGERHETPSYRIEGNIRDRIESLVAELDEYAENNSDLPGADAGDRMRTRGFEMWRDLVPEVIKGAILRHLDDITQLAIYCDREIVPWELLYPQFPDGREPGFLVQLFPVTRWVMGSPWGQTFSLSRPTFVVPDDSPASAEEEVKTVAEKLNDASLTTLRERRAVLTAIAEPDFTCLHFACHNDYTTQAGSKINFKNGELTPSDMSRLAATRPLGDKRALVFLNACRTQGSSPVYTSLEDWASAFLDLGASAVIGTSWSVRSGTARLIAETIYEGLVAGKTLGKAVEDARTAASSRLGDSSWLAYTVYGDPTAIAVSV